MYIYDLIFRLWVDVSTWQNNPAPWKVEEAQGNGAVGAARF